MEAEKSLKATDAMKAMYLHRDSTEVIGKILKCKMCIRDRYKNVNNEEQTLWVCCFVNYESKVFDYLKKGTQVYVCGDV